MGSGPLIFFIFLFVSRIELSIDGPGSTRFNYIKC